MRSMTGGPGIEAALTTQQIVTEYNNQSAPSTFYTMGGRDCAVVRLLAMSVLLRSVQAHPERRPTSRCSFRSTLSTWENVGRGGHIQNLVTAPNGSQEPADLIFTTSTPTLSAGVYTCGTSLNFETESYSSSTGALVDWVNVPSLSAGSVIYVCYGNGAVSTDQSHPSATWNSNYVAVYHFPTSPTGTINIYDSTSNGNNGTNSGSTAATGEIDGGASFSGGSILDSSPNNFPTIGGTQTLSAWYKVSSNPGSAQDLMALLTSPQADATQFRLNSPNFEVSEWGGSIAISATMPSAGSWHYVVFTNNGSTNNLYIDGASVASNSNALQSGAVGTFYMSSYDGFDESFTGNLDEARVSNTAVRLPG